MVLAGEIAACGTASAAHGDERRSGAGGLKLRIGWSWRARHARRRCRRGGGGRPGAGSRATSPPRSGSPRQMCARRSTCDVRNDVRDVRNDLRRMDDRLRAVEISFGKVDQRLETLERLHLPAPTAPGPAD